MQHDNGVPMPLGAVVHLAVSPINVAVLYLGAHSYGV